MGKHHKKARSESPERASDGAESRLRNAEAKLDKMRRPGTPTGPADSGTAGTPATRRKQPGVTGNPTLGGQSEGTGDGLAQDRAWDDHNIGVSRREFDIESRGLRADFTAELSTFRIGTVKWVIGVVLAILALFWAVTSPRIADLRTDLNQLGRDDSARTAGLAAEIDTLKTRVRQPIVRKP